MVGTAHHGLSQFHFRGNGLAVSLVVRQQQDFRIAGAQCGQDLGMADTIDMLKPHRNQVVRQPIAVPCQVRHGLTTGVQGMEHQARGFFGMFTIHPGHHVHGFGQGFERAFVHGDG